MQEKLYLATLIAALAGAAVSIENGHRIEIVPQAAAAPADACADATYRRAMHQVIFFEGGFVNGSDGGPLAARLSAPPPGCLR
jgi:hypothetical protein